jgi:fatty-acyl-CoA synthase
MTYSKCMTTNDLLLRSCRRYPQKTALIDGEHRYSYSELNTECNRLANSLLERNIKAGDRVALLAKNCKGFVISYFALPKIRAVLVPLNHRCVARELEYMLSDCEARALIFEAEYSETVSQLKDLLPQFLTTLSIGKRILPFAEEFDGIVSSGKAVEPDMDSSEDDECSILYTSGTTGKPKGAVITHRTRVSCTVNMLLDGSVETAGISLPGGPLFHTGTTNIALLPHVAAGGTVVVIPQLDPISIAEAIQRERVTHLATVPTVLHNMLVAGVFDRYDFSSLRKVYYGASTIPLKDLEKILSLFPNVEFYQGYGQTESTQLTVLRPEEQLPKFGCTGRAHLLVDLRVVDEDDRDVEPGETGEVITRGPHIMKGYLNLPEANQEAFRNGWFHTGDIARIDADGFITIVGRKKEMIIRGGENIYPREIELVLNSHPKIKEAAVFGIPDEKWGESVCAGIILQPNESLTEAEVIHYCKENLASYKKPRRVIFCLSFPRNSTGKVIKEELREIAARNA